MTYKIIDDALPHNDFIRIQYTMLNGGTGFPWYYAGRVNLLDKENYYLVHNFFKHNAVRSDFFEMIQPILFLLQPKAIVRIKGNFYPSSESLITHPMHTDFGYEHIGAIYYVNDNDGFTILEDGTKIESVANRLLIHKPHLLHCSTNCTDKHSRVNINFNYF